MKAMIIFLVFVMQSAAQLLFAQNLTIEAVSYTHLTLPTIA